MNNPIGQLARRRRIQLVASFVAMLGFAALNAVGAIPSPEKLLPDDTLFVTTIPDFAKMREIYKASPQTQFWSDPAMKAFRDKFTTKLKEEFITPLQRELGVNLDEYMSLPQGQLTFAVTQNGWQGSGTAEPALILLLDARDKTGVLKTNLANLRKKWIDDGKSIKTEKIRNIEFSVLPISEEDVPKSLRKLFGSDDDEGDSSDTATNKAPRSELVFGQYESLLIVGSSTKAVEKVAVRLTGGSAPALGELAAYESSRLALFRDAPFYGWINVKSFVDILTHKSADKGSEEMPAEFSAEKIISALGINGLKTAAFNFQSSNDGVSAQFFLGVPESNRQGIFKILPGEAKESGPPPFVPADAVKFQRWRIDGQKAWVTIQKVLSDISPQASGMVDMMLTAAEAPAKEKDPNFDIRKNLFGNLGDDIISYEKAPKGTTMADLSAAPSLFLLGSPHADQLAAALKSILTLMNRQGGPPTEREFLGRKIYSIPSPSSPVPSGDTKAAPSTLSYAASGNYVAMSTDAALLEEYLRSSDSPQKALREMSGLGDATSKVGGSSTGFFGYENQAETTRAAFEVLRKGSSSNDESMLAPGIPAFVPESQFKEWVDFSLLPPFEKVAKYFYFAVYSGSANKDGITFKMYSPVPPSLRK